MNPFWFLKGNNAASAKEPGNDARILAALSIPQRMSEGGKLSEQGYYRHSNDVLENLLTDLEGAIGPTVDDVRAKLLRLLGTNCFNLGEFGRSRAFTLKALEECRRVGDGVGIRTYVENLRFLNSQPASKDPRLIDLELALLRRLDRSQRLSDQARCKESNELLDGILHSKEPDESMLIERYRGKIHGLMGLNYFFGGAFDAACRCTEAAIEDCRRCGDDEGARVYTYNLERIRQAARR